MGSVSVPTAAAMGLVAVLTTFAGCGQEKESGAPTPSPSAAVPSDLDPDLVRVGTAFLRFARDGSQLVAVNLVLGSP